MSSTAVVLKFLMERNSTSSLHGQVTIGTLILQTNELYQLASVAFCLLVAWCSDKLGLSLELGSFSAGVMISTTDLAQHTLEQVEAHPELFCCSFPRQYWNVDSYSFSLESH
ncbi:K(+) efflux antiporter 6 [Abeliophyllum distichum]|uniref:K(+) efflux antiporter 6 n=1 Tax=Abeliophyllum distichum TaxID=126358 RepID=A0ABD1QH99_9LAMI